MRNTALYLKDILAAIDSIESFVTGVIITGKPDVKFR